MAELKLFRTWSSPFVLRVVWALDLKGIQYDTIFEDLSNKSSLLLQYNPIYKKVPVLVHNGKPLAESLVILEYIDETWKQTPYCLKILLNEPRHVLPSVWNVFIKQGKDQEEAIVTAHENLRNLEGLISGKKFFSGETIGLVDLAFGWLANLPGVFEEVMGVTLIEHEKYPFLLTWMHNFADAPIIKESWPPRDKLITKFKVLHEAYTSKEAAK
ncbi:glutathione transferase GST 23-like isoform X1 [Fagus crenata]